MIALLVDITEDAGADAFQTWFSRLSREDFIVVPIIYNLYDLWHKDPQHLDVSKAAISRCDGVFVVDIEGENEEFITEITEWAQDLGKKIIYRSALTNEN